MALQQTFFGELFDLTFSDTSVTTSDDEVSVASESMVALFITVVGGASTTKIDVGVQCNYANTNTWFDLAMVSTDFENQVANVIPFKLRFEGDTSMAVKVPVDVSGVDRFRLTATSSDGTGTLSVTYRISRTNLAGELI